MYIETDLTSSSSSSDSDIETDVCGSPRAQRKKRQKNFRPEKVERSTTFRTLNELFYNDNLPEVMVNTGIITQVQKDLGIASNLDNVSIIFHITSLAPMDQPWCSG